MTQQLDMPFDVTARKHGGDLHSRAANVKADPSKAARRSQIYTEAVKANHYGITCREMCHVLSLAARHAVHMNEISGRFTELAIAGRLVRSRITRDGCGVWLADVFAKAVQQ